MKRWVKLICISVVMIAVLITAFAYELYKKSYNGEPRDFDLFITEVFFKDYDKSPWDKVSLSEVRPIEWFINKKEYEKLDTVSLGFKNLSKEKMYYMSWGKPNSRIRRDFIVYRNGKADSIPFGGFGCGTGIYLEPLKKGKVVEGVAYNPLMLHPYSNYRLPVNNKKFPQLFKKLYGDSVSIKYKQATYSLPWSKYPPQMIESNEIVISTDKIIDNWRKGMFKPFPKNEKERDLSFYD